MSNKILVTKSSMPPLEEYVDEIKDIWESHWLTNNGKKHNLLGKELEDYLNVDNITLFTNGHLALENVIAAMDLKGEIITTPFTFVSTTHAIVRNGCVPVFCDIDSLTYTIDVNKIEDLITDKTVAILPVHVYGTICDVDKIQEIATKHNLKVIYDAAHSFGVEYNNKGIANFGDASIFSFHATKVFNTIEGGAAIVKDQRLIKKLNNSKNFGIISPTSCESISGNAKMNEFQAAMGLCNLRHIDQEIQKRKKIVARYRERLSNIEGIKLPIIQEYVKPNYAYFPVIFDHYYKDRDTIFEELAQQDIYARKYFYPLTCDFECYKDYKYLQNVDVARNLAKKVLTLPLYADLSLEDVDRICDIIISDN